MRSGPTWPCHSDNRLACQLIFTGWVLGSANTTRKPEFVTRHRVWRTAYSGVMSAGCFAVLRARVIKATLHSRVLVIHMERALTALGDVLPIPRSTYGLHRAPGVIVVRPDQLALWSDYADRMGAIGITRMILLEQQQAQLPRLVACFVAKRSRAQGRLRRRLS